MCRAAWSALEPMPTSAQMRSTGKALQSKAESLGISGSVSRQDLCLGRGVVFSQKLGWQQLQAVPALTVMLGGFGIFYCYKSLTC